MGFFTRLFVLDMRWKDEDEDEEEGESLINYQNHSNSSGVLFVWGGITIYKAVKGLFRKFISIFFQPKPKPKPPYPFLPLHNPPPPSLYRIRPFSSPTRTFDDVDGGDLECGHDVDHVLWRQGENYSVQRDLHVTCTSTSEEEEEKEEEVKSVILVVEERWIKHYSSRHIILLVGEGNFSFSACLAKAFRCASNIIATSLDSEAFLKENYKKASSNIEELKSRGSKVMHGIDATTMADHHLLGGFFPYLSTESQLCLHRRLVSMFIKNAKEMIGEDGEIHISHKTNGDFHAQFKLENIASSHGLRLIEAVEFKRSDYPGYNTKYGFGGDNNFNCVPSNTYKFGLKRRRSEVK